MIRKASGWCSVLIVVYFTGWLTSIACLAGDHTVVVAVDNGTFDALIDQFYSHLGPKFEK